MKLYRVEVRKEQTMTVYVEVPDDWPDDWPHGKLWKESSSKEMIEKFEKLPLTTWELSDGPHVDYTEPEENKKQRPDYTFN